MNVMGTKVTEKVCAKEQVKARIQIKVSETKAKAKVKVEVEEAVGKEEVEVSEVTKAEVEDRHGIPSKERGPRDPK